MIYRLIHDDVMAGLRQLADESVQTVVTSPPYWGLRDYGIEPSIWGGDPDCTHEWGDAIRTAWANAVQGPNGKGGKNAGGYRIDAKFTGPFCVTCGAWRGVFGLEPTPELYVDHAVAIFREVWRVLAKDGTLWLNLGDCYATSAGATNTVDPKAAGRKRSTRPGVNGRGDHQVECGLVPLTQPNRMPISGLKPKDLVGIPWRVAFALQADGWWLRSDIIWNKPNPMPESVTDRPTKAHEYLFLLAKSERYFYDAEAIKEPVSAAVLARPNINEFKPDRPDVGGTGHMNDRRGAVAKGYKMPDGWNTGPGAHGSFHPNGREKGRPAPKGNAKTFRGGGAYTGGQSFDNDAAVERGSHGNVPNETGLRNKRSVWTVATAPSPEAHFATFPPALIEPCILAGSRVGDKVLDPFSGSGTTGVVALINQRDYDGIERSGDYVAMSRRRLSAVAPMFTQEVSALPSPEKDVAEGDRP